MIHSILFVDEDEVLLLELMSFFSNLDYKVSTALGAKQALEILKKEVFSVVVTELHMKKMNGRELLVQLNQIESKPKIIFFSYDSELETITELIRLGAFDFVHKSASFERLNRSIQRAIDNLEMQILKKELKILNETKQTAYSLETWKEILQSRQNKDTSLLLENLRTAFTQGAGFGGLITIIQRIQKKAKKENGHYKVPANLLEVLFENANVAERVIDLLKYNASLHFSLRCERVTLREIYSILYDIATFEMSKYAKIKNQRIVLGENTLSYSTKSIWIDKSFFIKIIEELLFNAFKFSEANSKIFILFELIENYFTLEILNSPETFQNTVGIPDELSELIFEPFFRISKLIYAEYPTLDFGLGLTFVKEVVKQLQGKISAKNIKNHLESNNSILTVFQVQFPVYDSYEVLESAPHLSEV